MKIIPGLLLCMLVTPSVAQTLKLEDGACDMLVKHVPSPNAQYQSGVDAYGRPVAGADLAGTQARLGPIEIPLSVDLANRLNLPATANTDSSVGPGGAVGKYGNEAYIGTIIVDGETVLLNGQPLTDETEENLAILCMRANPPVGVER